MGFNIIGGRAVFVCLQAGAARRTYPMRGGFIYDEK